jgi:hypothetical protein
MKKLLLFISLLTVLALACGSAPATEAPATEAPATEAPATEAPATEAPATEAPVAEAPAFFTEDFSGGMDNWAQFQLGNGATETSKLSVTPGDSGVNVTIDTKQMFAYFMYTPYIYENVGLKMSTTNKGANSYQTLLICRFNEAGWYEFAMQNDGLWYLYAFDLATGKYNQIGNGGATNIKTGKETNEFGMDCVGDQIHLFVNGQELTGSPVKNSDFPEGQIGFSVSSFETFPVNVDVHSIEISEK